MKGLYDGIYRRSGLSFGVHADYKSHTGGFDLAVQRPILCQVDEAEVYVEVLH